MPAIGRGRFGAIDELDELLDVTLGTPSDGEALAYASGTEDWRPSDVVGAADLSDLADVNAGSPSDNQALTWDNATSKWIAAAITGGFYDAYVCLRDVKSQNAHGGTFTAGDWRTRDITEETADPQSICSISSNQITLAAGTYRCLISCPGMKVRVHQARLYDITNSTVLLLGTCSRADDGDTTQTRSVIAGRFTLAAETVLEVQHRCNITRADYGMGYYCTFNNEVYTQAEFWREA